MIGRFIGAHLLHIYSPGKMLASAAAVAILLLAVAGADAGAFSGWALLAIGLSNSIMFPTIFTLASEGLGSRAHEGSGIICIAIVGGAIASTLADRMACAWPSDGRNSRLRHDRHPPLRADIEHIKACAFEILRRIGLAREE